MKVYELHREQFLPISQDVAWDFFSHANNLTKITPEDMGFVVVTQLNDDPIYKGLKIDYRVKPIFNIPMSWTTEISMVEAPVKFTDTQLSGPYKLWEHTHTFETVPGGVKMTDVVKYALPLGILGVVAHGLFVKSRLNHIFDFRKETLVKYFGAFNKV